MKIKLKFEPRDIWVGVYWNISYSLGEKKIGLLDIYICPLPMCLIHIQFRFQPTKLPDWALSSTDICPKAGHNDGKHQWVRFTQHFACSWCGKHLKID